MKIHQVYNRYCTSNVGNCINVPYLLHFFCYFSKRDLVQLFKLLNMSELHPYQIKILNLLTANPEGNLSLNDIKEYIEANSRSLVQHHISQLVKKKYLYINPGNSRDFKILKNANAAYSMINVYGTAQCGFEGSVTSNDPIDRISISPALINFDVAKAFIVIAEGKSMQPKINEGDKLIVKRQKAIENSLIHVCSLDGEVIVKRVFEEPTKINLVSLNPEFAPLSITKDEIQNETYDFHVEGVVKSKIDYDFN